MIHFLKFVLFVLFVAVLMVFFISNVETLVSLQFRLPLTQGWVLPPILLDYLILGAFLSGILLAAAMGALRFKRVSRERKQLKALKESENNNENNADDLPSLHSPS